MSERYLRRLVDDELDALLPELPAIAIQGAKGVGKTATALRRAGTAYRLDERIPREIAAAQPQRLTAGATPILIDEWQRLPDSWDVVRRAVDDGAPPGSFLLTGSPPAPGTATHSGAGRIVIARMRPLSLAERGMGPTTVSLGELLQGERPAIDGTSQATLEDYAREIVQSGFPALRGLSGRATLSWLDGYVERIVDREFPEMGYVVRNPGLLRRWLTAYAGASSSSASFETIRDAATSGVTEKPSRSATMPYRDILERLYVVDSVPAWLPTRNHISRLGAAPKHHLVDPALAAQLLGVDVDGLLSGRDDRAIGVRDGPLLGALFESLVTQSIRVYAQAAGARVGHLRLHRGDREVDLIIERRDGRIIPIEVKLSGSVDDHDVRQLRWLETELGGDVLDSVIITTGPEAYRRTDGVAVVPATLLGP